jgi:hypothetical protein
MQFEGRVSDLFEGPVLLRNKKERICIIIYDALSYQPVERRLSALLTQLTSVFCGSKTAELKTLHSKNCTFLAK